MNQETATGAGAGGATPLDAFSQCHVAILAQLQALGELPALLEAAARARLIAAQTLEFFRVAVVEHHAQEERELFPAVLSSAVAGAESVQVQAIVNRLTAEHRAVESAWSKLEAGLREAAKGGDSALDAAAVAALVEAYAAHARYEEQAFLPLAQTILGRNSNHMAALCVALHMRQAMPDVLARYGHRI